MNEYHIYYLLKSGAVIIPYYKIIKYLLFCSGLNVLVLPESSIIYKNDSTYVKVLPGDKITKKAVKTEISDGKKVEIASRISAKDKIIPKP